MGSLLGVHGGKIGARFQASCKSEHHDLMINAAVALQPIFFILADLFLFA
jgi:hypothetical protein